MLKRINPEAKYSLTLDRSNIDEEESFQYLRTKVTSRGVPETTFREDWATVNKLSKCRTSGELQRRRKVIIYNSNVLVVLMHGSDKMVDE